MKLKVKKIGNKGLHVYIPRKLGYKEGDSIEITDKNFNKKVREIVREEISAARNY